MATIIDSLLVKLGLDSSEFEAKKSKVDKGLKDTGAEAEKTGSKLKKSGKDGADGFENVAKSAAKFLAIIGGTMAVKRFIENQIEANAALDRFAQNLDQSANSISAWSNAAELAGGSAEGLQGTMDMLSKSQTELQLTGQSSLIPYFSAREVFYISGTIALPSTGESFTLTRGILTNAKQIPDAQKVLQPMDFVITWESVNRSLL